LSAAGSTAVNAAVDAVSGESLIPQAHRLLLVRHARSQVDPQREPRTWGLAEGGRRDAERLAALAVFDHASGYYAGAEPKLEQTLAPVAAAHGMTVQADPALGESGSTGWLGEEGRFREVVRRFFDHPQASPAPGWETRAEATERFKGAVARLLPRHPVVVHRGHALPGTVAIASGGRILCAFLADALGLDAERALALWSALKMPDLAVLELAPDRAARLVVPFGTIAY
jgi:broad specificity phosphatase PhoE